MALETKTDHEHVIGLQFEAGEAPSCEWHKDVCLEASEHKIIYLLPKGEEEVLTFCARHYVLALADFLEVHLPGCVDPGMGHLRSFGSI